MPQDSNSQHRIGLYGGSFDPIHHGHLIVARNIAERLNLDQLLFLPSANPPHKQSQVLTDADHRSCMVELAIADEPRFEMNDRDLNQAGPTYTIDTIDSFKGQFGDHATLYWIIGGDSLAELHTWHRAADLVDRCIIVTAARPGWAENMPALPEETFSPEQIDRLRRNVLDTPLIEISATDIRRRAMAGLSIRYLVPDCVDDYIRKHRLYQRDSAD